MYSSTYRFSYFQHTRLRSQKLQIQARTALEATATYSTITIIVICVYPYDSRSSSVCHHCNKTKQRTFFVLAGTRRGARNEWEISQSQIPKHCGSNVRMGWMDYFRMSRLFLIFPVIPFASLMEINVYNYQSAFIMHTKCALCTEKKLVNCTNIYLLEDLPI